MKTFNQFLDIRESKSEDCPKCDRELSSDAYCSHCDHYVNKDGSVKYPEDMKESSRDEYRTAKVMHKGKHVANINTYRGRAGGWVSQVDNLDGSSAHKKYGIDLMDTKKEMLRKIKQHHKGN